MGNGRRDVAKERWWRAVIARQVASTCSVREFCRRESLAESAFHSWRRTIAARDGQLTPLRRQIAELVGQVAAPGAARNAPAFVPAVFTHTARRDSAMSDKGALPVDGAMRDNRALPCSGASERDGAITIELSGGCVLRLPASLDVARIVELVHALETRGAR